MKSKVSKLDVFLKKVDTPWGMSMQELEQLQKEIAELKTENERLNTNLNNFIEELAWRDVQFAAQESGMWNEACGQPSRSAISTYRKSYDKLYSECAVGDNAKERAEARLKELEEIEE